MSDEKFPNPSGLTEEKVRKLLSRLVDPTGTEDGDNKRHYARAARISCDVEMELEHVGGGITRSIACSRNLSARGVSLICTGFAHKGSKVRLSMGRIDEGRDAMQGVVVHCHHLEGRFHELGIALDDVVDPTLYIDDDDALKAVREQQLAECPELKGWALHLSSSRAEAALIEHYLRITNVDITLVDTPGRALDEIKKDMLDIALIDADTFADSVPDFLRQIRTESFTGRVVVLTANESTNETNDLKNAGADFVIIKPFAQSRLQAVLMEALERAGCVLGQDEIQSTLSNEPGVAKMITEYVNETKQHARNIDKAIVNEDLPAIELACLCLKGSGTSFGFESVTEQAEEALKQLHASMSIRESTPYLRKLSLICTRLSSKKAA